MILDKENLFSDDQAVITTAASENVIDTGAAKDVGPGEPLRVQCQVSEEDFAGGTSIAVALQTATDAAFTSPVTLFTTEAIALASLVAGYEFAIPMIPKGALRYLRLNYTVVGTMNAGKITAGLLFDKQQNDFGEA